MGLLECDEAPLGLGLVRQDDDPQREGDHSQRHHDLIDHKQRRSRCRCWGARERQLEHRGGLRQKFEKTSAVLAADEGALLSQDINGGMKTGHPLREWHRGALYALKQRRDTPGDLGVVALDGARLQR